MTDLKRTISGVTILADTTDREKAAKVQKILDAAMKALTEKNAAKQQSTKGKFSPLDAIFGGHF